MADSVSDRDKVDSMLNGAEKLTIESVVEELRKLRQVFDAKIRYDEGRERVIESMGEELAKYHQGLDQTLLRPVLLDLIAMHDAMTQILDVGEVTNETLGNFRDEIEEILARNSVQKYSEEGDAVVVKRQRVLSMVDTPDAALAGLVAERFRAGFAWDERILRPEWVSAYRHKAAEAEEGAPT
jgi:molecular chaperone GrpE